MKIFYDLEFLEDGRHIDPISLGMVAEDGRELYMINDQVAEGPLYERIVRNHWLMKYVVPYLPLVKLKDKLTRVRLPSSSDAGRFDLDMSDVRVAPLYVIRNQVREFILHGTPPLPAEPELWAYYGAYDHVGLCQLFGTMIQLPAGIPMWTNDLKQLLHRAGNPEFPVSDDEHDALEDARWGRRLYQFLEERDMT